MRKQQFLLLLAIVLAFAFVSWCFKPPAKAATTIFSDGFESGTFLTTDVPPGAWTSLAVGSGSTAAISSESPHHGSYSAKFIAASASWSCVKKFFTGAATAFVRAYYTFGTSPGLDEKVYLIELRASNSFSVGVILENVSGDLFWVLSVTQGGTTYTTYETAPSNPTTGVPYCVELKRDAPSGLEELWVDGASKATNNVSMTNYSTEIVIGYGYNAAANPQTCYVDCVVVADAYVGPESSDSVPPTFGDVSTNTTIAGHSCIFSCLVNDDTNVSASIFSTNNTGAWRNDTAVVFSSFHNATAAWANITKTLNDTVGSVVSYRWFANDMSDNWSHSVQYNLTVTAAQHYLTVFSPYGAVGGQGWYSEGSTAYAILDTGIVDHGNGTRRVFTNWSGDASGTVFSQSNPVTMIANKTAVAVWKTQYNVTFTQIGLDASASGTVVTVNSVPAEYNQLPYAVWIDSGGAVTYSYSNVSSTIGGKRFILVNVSGQSSPLTVTGPALVEGNYTTQYRVTFDQTGVGSDFTGTLVTIGGENYTYTSLPAVFWWVDGSSHTFSFQSPLNAVSDSLRYLWISTTGLSSLQDGTILVSASGNITAEYKTQYYLTVSSTYDSPTPTTGWFDAGTGITASVTSPAAGPTGTRYVCHGWTGTGDVPAAGTDLSVNFTITQSSSLTWNWTTQHLLTVLTDPEGLSPQPTRDPVGEAESLDSWWYDESTGVDLTAQDVEWYTFNYWTVDGASQGTSVNPITVNLGAPRTAVAYYFLSDITSPEIVVLSPENATYYTASVSLEFTINETASWVGYSLDGQANITISGNTTLVVGEGSHSIIVYANDTAGNMGTSNTVYFTARTGVSDIAILSIQTSKTIIGQGYSLTINVTVENQGDYAESFNVTLYGNTTVIGTHDNVILPIGNTTVLTFMWNTSEVARGNYTITAYAAPVRGETETGDNEGAGGWVIITIPGDVDGDRDVGIFDIVRMAIGYGTTPPNPAYDPDSDVDGDGDIDIFDIVAAASNYGKSW